MNYLGRKKAKEESEEESKSEDEGDEEEDEEEEEEEEEEERDTKKGRGRGAAAKGRPPRMAVQRHKSSRTVSLDDYIVSDDDFMDGESEEETKPKKRGKRKSDDSGSDWEMEHKGKGSKRKYDSESDSGSDWENEKRSDKRKKKASYNFLLAYLFTCLYLLFKFIILFVCFLDCKAFHKANSSIKQG